MNAHGLEHGWYVLRTETQRERRAELALREIGFEVYLPTETRWRRHARTKRQVEVPLLPGYLFVLIEADTPMAVPMVLDADGVDSFVSFSSQPRPIRGDFIDRIRKAQDEGDFDQTKRTAGPRPKVGDEVKITGGMFTGWIAKVKQLEPAERVRVLFDFMRREIEVTLEPGQVEVKAKTAA